MRHPQPPRASSPRAACCPARRAAAWRTPRRGGRGGSRRRSEGWVGGGVRGWVRGWVVDQVGGWGPRARERPCFNPPQPAKHPRPQPLPTTPTPTPTPAPHLPQHIVFTLPVPSQPDLAPLARRHARLADLIGLNESRGGGGMGWGGGHCAVSGSQRGGVRVHDSNSKGCV